MINFGKWCTKNHTVHGILDYATIGVRVRLEARYVIVGYGQECELPL